MSDTIRRKTVNFDGAEFVIAELTLKQAREIAAETKTLDVIAQSLNRAAGASTYTVENLEDSIGAKTRKELFEAILDFSGLRNEGGASGETSA